MIHKDIIVKGYYFIPFNPKKLAEAIRQNSAAAISGRLE